MAPRPPERAETVQQDDQRACGDRFPVRAARLGLRLDHVEPDAVGVDVEVTPRPGDAGDRRVGWGHYQPEGSVGAGAVPDTGTTAFAGPWPVNAALVSLTDSIVFCGPRMR